MKILNNFFKKRPKKTANDAHNRLQIMLAHDRVGENGNSELIETLKAEIMEVLARHVPMEKNMLDMKIDTKNGLQTLEIDIEVPTNFTPKKR